MLEKKRHRRRWLKASNRWSVTFKIWRIDILLKYLVGATAYLQPQQAQWFIALPSYISKSDLIADLENFIQTGVLCACCWMSDSWLLELELAPVASLALLAWFGLLLWKNLDKQTGSCLGMCALSSVLSELYQQQLLLFSTFHSNIILKNSFSRIEQGTNMYGPLQILSWLSWSRQAGTTWSCSMWGNRRTNWSAYILVQASYSRWRSSKFNTSAQQGSCGGVERVVWEARTCMDLITRGRGAFLHDFAHKAPLTKIVHLENYNRQGEPLKKDEMI